MFIRLNIIFVIIIIIPYLFIYLVILKIPIIKVQFFKNLTSEFNFQSKKFYYSRSFV